MSTELTCASYASQRPVPVGHQSDHEQSETRSGNHLDALQGNSHQARLHNHKPHHHVALLGYSVTLLGYTTTNRTVASHCSATQPQTTPSRRTARLQRHTARLHDDKPNRRVTLLSYTTTNRTVALLGYTITNRTVTIMNVVEFHCNVYYIYYITQLL